MRMKALEPLWSSLYIILLLLLAGCSKEPANLPQSEPNQRAQQDQKEEVLPPQPKPFKDEVYEMIDGSEKITITTPEELEISSKQMGNIICSYTKQGDQIRVVFDAMGTKRALYFRITKDGLEHERTIYYAPDRLKEVRQIVAMNLSLIAAVKDGHAYTARDLLKQGANPKLLCEQKTLLHFAVYRSDLPMVKVLLDGGVDPNAFDPKGQLARIPHYPVPNPEIIRELVQRGAKLNLVDEYGHTTLFNFMQYWLMDRDMTAKTNAIILVEAGGRFSEKDKLDWAGRLEGSPGSTFYRASQEQLAIAQKCMGQ